MRTFWRSVNTHDWWFMRNRRRLPCRHTQSQSFKLLCFPRFLLVSLIRLFSIDSRDFTIGKLLSPKRIQNSTKVGSTYTSTYSWHNTVDLYRDDFTFMTFTCVMFPLLCSHIPPILCYITGLVFFNEISLKVDAAEKKSVYSSVLL